MLVVYFLSFEIILEKRVIFLEKSWKSPGIFLWKLCGNMILKVTKNQGFALSLEDTFFKKPQNSSYWGKLTCSFFLLKKFVSRSIFGELLLMQLSLNFKTLCCNLKIRGLVAKSPCFLLNKKVNFSKSKTESKMESPTDAFSETN